MAQSPNDALIGAIVNLFVDQLVPALVPALAERLRTEMARAPRYATARENPLGSRRAFLDAHRDGAFPTFRRGREIAADWTAVEAWMRSRQGPPVPPPANDGAPTIDDMVAACAAPRRRRGRAGG